MGYLLKTLRGCPDLSWLNIRVDSKHGTPNFSIIHFLVIFAYREHSLSAILKESLVGQVESYGCQPTSVILARCGGAFSRPTNRVAPTLLIALQAINRGFSLAERLGAFLTFPLL